MNYNQIYISKFPFDGVYNKGSILHSDVKLYQLKFDFF